MPTAEHILPEKFSSATAEASAIEDSKHSSSPYSLLSSSGDSSACNYNHRTTTLSSNQANSDGQQSPDSAYSGSESMANGHHHHVAEQADFDDEYDGNSPYTMAQDYIKYRIELGGKEWHDCPDLPDPTDARLAMRQLGSEFELQNADQLAELVQLQLDTIDNDPHQAYPRYRSVCDTLFENGSSVINWGRIVALYAFTGASCFQCLSNGRRVMVGQMANWLGSITRDKLTPWIEQNGGWNAFVKSYEAGSLNSQQDAHFKNYNWTRLAVGAAGVGAVTVGAVTLKRMLSE